MPDWNHLLPFFTATLVFAFLPGPALLYTAAQTLAHGRRGGFMAALGLHIGGLVHVFAAAAGLSAVFTHVPAAYTVLKVAGAIYLVWLGIGIIRTKMDPSFAEPGRAPEQVPPRQGGRAFLHSVMVEVLNPKTALFFIAFLPQFADAGAAFPVWVQFLILGLIVGCAFSMADLIAVLLTHQVLAGMKRTRTAQRIAQWTGGSVLVGLGAHLALSK